jgi:hypothetical protein
VIIFPPIIQTILVDPVNNIINQSFGEDKQIVKPLEKSFKENLEVYKITEEDIINKLSCSICQDEFKLNEETVKLPCNGAPHFFHKTNTEECNGIYPWFEEHNTCPMCRFEYPHEPEPEPESEPEPEPDPESVVIEREIILIPEQIIEMNDNDRENTIDNILREAVDNIFNQNEEQNNNSEIPDISSILQPIINNIAQEEMARQMEEEELQNAILRSVQER